MGLRATLERYRYAVAGAALLLLGLSTAVLVRSSSGFGGSEVIGRSVWYFDPKTEGLFLAVDSLPPIASPSDALGGLPTGLRAYVYACGSCADESARFIGYLERFSDEARQRLAEEGATAYDGPRGINEVSPDRMAIAMGTEGRQVRAAEADAAWVDADSPQADAVTSVSAGRCGQDELVACEP